MPIYHEYSLQKTLYLGTLKGTNFFAVEVEKGSFAPSGWVWKPLRPLYSALSEAEYALAGYAMQLLHWDRTNAFCGVCGKHTITREHERCRECKSCGYLAYPKVSLAILALVKRGDQILLARNPEFIEPFYSTLAGFVDPGETLEQCVIREVLEETGIQVANVRYFGSQPWPLSYSLMIGFTCEWQEGEIQVNPSEIAEAAWFNASSLPHLPPIYSLSRIMIDEFVKSSRTQ